MRHLHTVRDLLVAAAVVASVMGAESAFAQSTAAYDELGRHLRHGDAVTITGPTLGEVKGKVTGLVPDTVQVRTATDVRSIPMSEIDHVRRKRMGVRLGAIIGAAVGVTSGALLYAAFVNEGGATGEAVALGLTSFGVGIGIDAAINLPRAVYRRADPMTMRVKPYLTAGGGAVGMHIGW